MNVEEFNELIRCIHDSGEVYARGVAKKPPYDPGSDGVPPEMFDGEVDEEGWVKWKIVPSTLSEADALSFFRECCITPPRPLVEYMKSDFHHLDEVSTGLFPCIPSDNPFRPMRELLEAPGHKPLIALGYIPIASKDDDQGVICVTSDGQVVWFDHEALADLWWPPSRSLLTWFSWKSPKDPAERIKSLEQPLFDSLDGFYAEALKCPPGTGL